MTDDEYQRRMIGMLLNNQAVIMAKTPREERRLGLKMSVEKPRRRRDGFFAVLTVILLAIAIGTLTVAMVGERDHHGARP